MLSSRVVIVLHLEHLQPTIVQDQQTDLTRLEPLLHLEHLYSPLTLHMQQASLQFSLFLKQIIWTKAPMVSSLSSVKITLVTAHVLPKITREINRNWRSEDQPPSNEPPSENSLPGKYYNHILRLHTRKDSTIYFFKVSKLVEQMLKRRDEPRYAWILEEWFLGRLHRQNMPIAARSVNVPLMDNSLPRIFKH